MHQLDIKNQNFKYKNTLNNGCTSIYRTVLDSEEIWKKFFCILLQQMQTINQIDQVDQKEPYHALDHPTIFKLSNKWARCIEFL